MKLTLIGHDYRYAVEQIMLMMYPDERPDDAAGNTAARSAEVRLHMSHTYATAVTKILNGNTVYRGVSRVRRDALAGKLISDRLLQKIIKLSFYKAAVSETGKKPVWGALTGIRPGKIVTSMLERGFTDKKALDTLREEYFVSPRRGALCLDTAKAALVTKASLLDKDVALYIGIPFCPTRCHYCSFVSHSVEKSMKLIGPFLEALHKEIEALSEIVYKTGLRIIAVYIGGGTPTTLSAVQLEHLMGKLASSFDFAHVREYTVEAGRPDTVTKEKLEVILKNGADRISINPQTMSDAVLDAVGRRHTAEDVSIAMRAARDAGFECINMDLIAGLPGDTAEGFIKSLDSVLALEPENITVHTLSLKKGTRIRLDGVRLPDGGAVSVMLDQAEKALRGKGYVPYYLYRQKFMSGGFENVGWCLSGRESLYNILIMEELATILALGGGSVTKLVNNRTGKIDRIFNMKFPYEYIAGIDRVIDSKARIAEYYKEG